MDALRHAWLARRLIDACGGLDASSRACRLNRSRLSDCQNPNLETAHLPADVIADLEAYCGEPHYSRELFEARPANIAAADLVTEACETTEAVAALQALIRTANRDGKLTAAERRLIAAGMAEIEQQWRELKAAAQRAGGAP